MSFDLVFGVFGPSPKTLLPSHPNTMLTRHSESAMYSPPHGSLTPMELS
jgi:hypothetical protein